MTTPKQQSDSCFNWGFGAMLILTVLLIAYCSIPGTQPLVADNTMNVDEVSDETSNEVAAAPLPLDRSAMIKGAKQLQLVASLGLPGARRIFSQNCYDALEKAFDWHQLDRCGEFDALAVRLADEDTGLPAEELDYFQPETAATRFLGAATGHGLAGPDADVRWAALEEGARAIALPSRAAAVTPDAGADEDAASDSRPASATEDEDAGSNIASDVSE
jgi:hypothetical protein